MNSDNSYSDIHTVHWYRVAQCDVPATYFGNDSVDERVHQVEIEHQAHYNEGNAEDGETE